MMSVTTSQLETIFNRVFASLNTRLVGGANEPLYLPADESCHHHRLYFREDFVASALHEIAHWCIAGEQRRQLPDFGYWYQPDGRTQDQQRSFEQVEVKPQALEWLFANACQQKFTISADNLSTDDPEAMGPSKEFLTAVVRQAKTFCEDGAPPRAHQFIAALEEQFHGSALDSDCYAINRLSN